MGSPVDGATAARRYWDNHQSSSMGKWQSSLPVQYGVIRVREAALAGLLLPPCMPPKDRPREAAVGDGLISRGGGEAPECGRGGYYVEHAYIGGRPKHWRSTEYQRTRSRWQKHFHLGTVRFAMDFHMTGRLFFCMVEERVRSAWSKKKKKKGVRIGGTYISPIIPLRLRRAMT